MRAGKKALDTLPMKDEGASGCGWFREAYDMTMVVCLTDSKERTPLAQRMLEV